MKMRHMFEKMMLLIPFLSLGLMVQGQTWDVQAMADQKKMKVTLDKASNDMKLRILDEEGHLLVDEAISPSELPGKVFNLEKLAIGPYTLVYSDARVELERDFSVTATGVEIQTGEQAYYKPVFQYRDKKLDVSFFNREKGAVSVKIRNEKGDLVYQDELKESFLLEKRYNLDGLASGNYSVVVQTPRKNYYKELAVR